MSRPTELAAAADGEEKGSRRPNPIDVHVGSRVRFRRMLLGMSQEKLGEKLGLTFQQIQKYEKGINRIGASRLFDLAQVLGVSVQFFYEEAPTGEVPRFV
ncbi:MAG: XRE family transcriptional regulator, partial [Hyphomicrobiaceae bacterium]